MESEDTINYFCSAITFTRMDCPLKIGLPSKWSGSLPGSHGDVLIIHKFLQKMRVKGGRPGWKVTTRGGTCSFFFGC